MRLRDRGEAVAWLTLSPGVMSPRLLPQPLKPRRGCRWLATRCCIIYTDSNRTLFTFLDAAEQISGRPDVIEWLLTNMPACMRLALAGRTLASAFRLPALRSLLHEFGCDDLVYSSDEIRQLLGPWLSTADQERILGIVLGAWPALVSLAAQVFSSRPGPVARAKIMEGRHAVLRDLILQEALNQSARIGDGSTRLCGTAQFHDGDRG